MARRRREYRTVAGLAAGALVLLLAGCTSTVRDPLYYSRRGLDTCLYYAWVGPGAYNSAQAVVVTGGGDLGACVKAMAH